MKVELKVINFVQYPGARYRVHGPDSGEYFRDDVLMSWIGTHGCGIIINFNGAPGYPSIFLEEVFGGAVREGIPPKTLFRIIDGSIFDDCLDVKEEILRYIKDADDNRLIVVNRQLRQGYLYRPKCSD